jgi:hypothetical protein
VKRLEEISTRPWLAKLAWGIVVGLLFLLQLYQNAANIGHKPVWLDEASTWMVAAKPLGQVFTLPAEFHSQPPLYYLIIHFLLNFSSSEWFLRGFSWLCGTGLLFFVLFFVDELGLFARVAFCILYIFGPIAHFLCQELRPYSMSATFNLISLIFFLRLLREPSRATMKWYIALTTISLYTLSFDLWSFTLQGFVALGVISWEMKKSGVRAALQKKRELAWGVGASALLYVPYFLLVVHFQRDAVAKQPSLSAIFEQASRSDHLIETLRVFNYLPAPWTIAIYALALGALASAIIGGREVLILAGAIVVHVGLVHGFLFQRSFMAERYFTPVWPIFIFLVAVGLDGVSRLVDRRAWIALTIALLWWVSDLKPSWAAYREAPLPFVGWRAVAQHLREQPGTKVVFFSLGYEGTLLEYETRNDPEVAMRLNKRRRWSAGGQEMDEPYVKKSIQETEAAARCYYYQPTVGVGISPSLSVELDRVYNSVFASEMARLGMQPVQSPGEGLRGYCKP